jgi:hypothetical protein
MWKLYRSIPPRSNSFVFFPITVVMQPEPDSVLNAILVTELQA